MVLTSFRVVYRPYPNGSDSQNPESIRMKPFVAMLTQTLHPHARLSEATNVHPWASRERLNSFSSMNPAQPNGLQLSTPMEPCIAGWGELGAPAAAGHLRVPADCVFPRQVHSQGGGSVRGGRVHEERLDRVRVLPCGRLSHPHRGQRPPHRGKLRGGGGGGSHGIRGRGFQHIRTGARKAFESVHRWTGCDCVSSKSRARFCATAHVCEVCGATVFCVFITSGVGDSLLVARRLSPWILMRVRLLIVYLGMGSIHRRCFRYTRLCVLRMVRTAALHLMVEIWN